MAASIRVRMLSTLAGLSEADSLFAGLEYELAPELAARYQDFGLCEPVAPATKPARAAAPPAAETAAEPVAGVDGEKRARGKRA